ncbi:hypothetical protein AYJ57_22445 (plasmid) [Salipiger sp. CCB-MM3]|uniref:acyltransferase family protein n=1 Tax=Salipiger sp. CCB-MM3 TaxID=1792508 RepID=UPI00080AAD8D|nr:acyltransferase [Salipiger sp. CCB-MM3]ANT63239.1 hypothetical protein AYJ57_22445 [Salipiger sp. CCB-MM3]
MMIYNLQVLRAVAAAMVVLHHLREALAEAFPSVVEIEVGAAGVDIFFVLSGVVITLTEEGRNDGAFAFLKRRALRIVPMYWLTLWLIGLALFAGLSPIGVQPEDGTVGKMLLSMFFIPFEREHGAIMPLLGVGWTLNYEAFFYVVVAILLVLPGRFRSGALVVVMLLLSLAGVLLQPDSVAGQFYLNPILLEFAAGVVLAQLWLNWTGVVQSGAVVGTALLCVGIALFAFAARPEEFTFLMRDRVLWFGIPAVCCVAGALLLERSGHSLRTGWLQWLGAASYVLYLSHAIVIQVAEKAFARLNLALDETIAALSFAATVFVAAHLVGVALHLYLERPITLKLKSKRAPAQRERAAAGR